MRILFALGPTLAAALACESIPAQAAAAAWCANVSIGEGSVAERCEYRTFEDCRQAIIGQGPSFCVQSPGSMAAAEKILPRRKQKPQTR